MNESGRNSKSRRRFIKNAGTVSFLSILPSSAVWGDGMIAGSIVASGHGSDYAANNRLQLLSPGKWKNWDWDTMYIDKETATFGGVFAEEPFGALKDSNGELITDSDQRKSIRLIDILEHPGSADNNGAAEKYGGPSQVNVFLIETYLNAVHHNQTFGGETVYFPVLMDRMLGEERGLFPNQSAFADYLWQKAASSPAAVGEELSLFLNNNHHV